MTSSPVVEAVVAVEVVVVVAVVEANNGLVRINS